MVVLSVRQAVVVHLEAGVLSGVWRSVDREVSRHMANEEVKRSEYMYCRFCGAYNDLSGRLKHKGNCQRHLVAYIDHVPVKRGWCAMCEHDWEPTKYRRTCPECGSDCTVIRYL